MVFSNFVMPVKNKPQRFRFLITAMFGLGMIGVIPACAPQETSASTQEATSDDKKSNVDPKIFKATKETYLSDAEKAAIKNGFDVSELSLDDRKSLARRLGNESDQAQRSGDSKGGRYFTEMAHRIRVNVADEFPDDYFQQLFLYTSIASIGKLEETEGNYSDARKYYLESLSLLKENVPTNPDHKSLWLRLKMWRYKDIGNLDKKLQRYVEAKVSYEKYLELVITNPNHNDYFYDYAEAHFFLGELSLEQQLWAEAEDSYKSSARILERLLTQPDNGFNIGDEAYVKQRLGNTYRKFGYAALRQRDQKTVLETYEKAIDLYQSVSDSDISNTAYKLDLGSTYFYAGQYLSEDKQAYFEKAQEIFNQLNDPDIIPAEYREIMEKTRKALDK